MKSVKSLNGVLNRVSISRRNEKLRIPSNSVNLKITITHHAIKHRVYPPHNCGTDRTTFKACYALARATLNRTHNLTGKANFTAIKFDRQLINAPSSIHTESDFFTSKIGKGVYSITFAGTGRIDFRASLYFRRI